MRLSRKVTSHHSAVEECIASLEGIVSLQILMECLSILSQQSPSKKDEIQGAFHGSTRRLNQVPDVDWRVRQQVSVTCKAMERLSSMMAW